MSDAYNSLANKCCTDCAMWIANNDDSGASDSWDKNLAYRTLMDYSIVITGDEAYFSTAFCDVCCDNLAGDRLDIEMYQNI